MLPIAVWLMCSGVAFMSRWTRGVTIAGLLMRRPVLMGHKELTKEDLVGYEEYRADVYQLDENAIADFSNKLIALSKKPPLQVTLQKSGKNVEVIDIQGD
jgi:hypothetical protein